LGGERRSDLNGTTPTKKPFSFEWLFYFRVL
jgi:hypothetical protein